jgi:multiple sugar transport system substrate-binding protein
VASQFDQDTLDHARLFDATAGRRSFHALPMGRSTNHLHVWRSLLEQAGFTLADIPREWESFWSFWCDQVQPAVREATGRGDIYGVGLPMVGAIQGNDPNTQFRQFVEAYEAHYVTRDGRLVIDEPLVRASLVKALGSYAGLYRKGCTPPDAIEWNDGSNNKAFLAQMVVMTPNLLLSIPNALKVERSEDYYRNTVTIEWPTGAYGQPLAIVAAFYESAWFKAGGGHIATAKEFAHFLVGEGWLAHWLDFAGDRMLPPFPALLQAPFWISPGDPHRMRSAIQFLTRPRIYDYVAASGEWRHQRVTTEGVWPKAIHRVAADGLSPEQAVDEAIARIKQILSE